MWEWFLRQTRKEHSPGRRLAALVVQGFFFLGVLPVALVVASSLSLIHI